MQHKPSLFPDLIVSVGAVLRKDALSELRSKYAFSTLIVFALTCLSAISMSIAGGELTPHVQSVFLWVVLFFSAMAGLGRAFVQEQDAGTLLTLKVYTPPQAVYFGKIIFNVLLLVSLSVLVLFLFIVFFDISVSDWVALIGALWLGSIGLSIVATMTAAMAAQAQGRSSLFTILTFPIILPEFLNAIETTRTVLAGEAVDWTQFMFLGGYALVALIAGSVLFDYLWVE
ncbi:MAG: heme exporter protein CcmB [Gracilibacteraceae bacterium]|jgi:heme exporter protein B|nr:heme exporter protein CcmB [Gracilibacteraceae bacterium]